MKSVLRRLFILLPGVILQVAFYLVILSWFKNLFPIISIFTMILSFFIVLRIITKVEEATYKMLWLILILIAPIFGTVLYLLFGNKVTTKKLKKNIEKSKKDIHYKFKNNDNMNVVKNEDFRLYQTLNRVKKLSSFPMCNNNSKYYKFGEEMFKDMLMELKKAKKYIFIEYFIIQNGEFLNSIVDILKEKVKEGVDVRILYDDIGSIKHPLKETIDLMKDGIKCCVFNPLFLISGTLNNRDHRKMMIIDGDIVFSGGVNIADEYINKINRFGVWKDIGFKLKGEGVQSYVYMFIEFWNAFSNEKIDYKILNQTDYENIKDDGYVLSYYDSPSNDVHISHELYIDLFSLATKYVWFYSPYLILSESLQNAMINAAQRGVDIRLIIPGIPDKKMPYRMAKSFYKVLINSGVKIYEYTPGFVHAKACIVDDKVCTIGTVNLDYRSLFLHYECNSIFYKASILKSLKRDYLDTQKECKEVKKQDINTNLLHNVVDAILRIVSPLC